MVVTLEAVFQDRDEKLRGLFASLEATIKEKDGFIQEASACWKALKEDFTYNLKLLEERDVELERYDVLVESTKTELNQKESIISELRILLSDRANEINSLTLLIQSQDKQHHDTCRRMRLEKENAVQEIQQAHSAKEFEWEQKLAKLELQNKSLQSDLNSVSESEKKLKTEIWELNDQKKNSNSRVNELEAQVGMLMTDLKKTISSNEEQKQSLLNRLSEMESNHAKEKACFIENSAHLQVELENLLANSRCDRQLHEEEIVALDQLIRAKEKDIEELKAVISKQDSDVSKIMESQSLEIHNINSELRQRSEAYREELAKIVKLHNTSITQLQADLDIRERQVDELQTALERQRLEFGDIKDELKRRIDHEQKLQNALTSRDIQFQEQLEEVKRKKERESNALISSLISEKEKLDAELKLIRHQNESLQAQYPNLNIIQEEHEGNVAELHNTVEFLQKENEDLVRTIRAMREDMETIQKSVQDGNGGVFGQSGQTGYQGEIRNDDAFSNIYYNEALTSNAQMKALADIIKTKQEIIDSMIQGQGYSQPMREGSGFGNPTALISELEETKKENENLRSKLRQAVEDIVTISRERAKVIEISNSTKAMLNFAQKPAVRTKNAGSQTAPIPVQEPAAPLKTKITTTESQIAKPESSGPRKPYKSTSPVRNTGKGARSAFNAGEPLDPALARKAELRQRGVRNWNERDD